MILNIGGGLSLMSPGSNYPIYWAFPVPGTEPMNQWTPMNKLLYLILMTTLWWLYNCRLLVTELKLGGVTPLVRWVSGVWYDHSIPACPASGLLRSWANLEIPGRWFWGLRKLLSTSPVLPSLGWPHFLVWGKCVSLYAVSIVLWAKP